jgi:hypothetical protein
MTQALIHDPRARKLIGVNALGVAPTGATAEFEERTSGPINAVFFDREHGTLWGGSSNHGDDYGIAW